MGNYIYTELMAEPLCPHLRTAVHTVALWLCAQSQSYFEWNCRLKLDWLPVWLLSMQSPCLCGSRGGHRACETRSPSEISDTLRREVRSLLMDVSVSDRSGSDVRRRLHGGGRLAACLPDHCQLSPVPPTQALALRITLHEHAERREFWFTDMWRPRLSPPHIRLTACCFCLISLGAGAGVTELGDQMWWTGSVFVTIIFPPIFPREMGIDVMHWTAEVSQISGLSTEESCLWRAEAFGMNL